MLNTNGFSDPQINITVMNKRDNDIGWNVFYLTCILSLQMNPLTAFIKRQFRLLNDEGLFCPLYIYFIPLA